VVGVGADGIPIRPEQLNVLPAARPWLKVRDHPVKTAAAVRGEEVKRKGTASSVP